MSENILIYRSKIYKKKKHYAENLFIRVFVVNISVLGNCILCYLHLYLYYKIPIFHFVAIREVCSVYFPY